MCRTRVETEFRNTEPSADGSFSPRIKPEVNNKLTMYCRLLNRNRTEVVNELIETALDDEFAAFVEWKKGGK